MRALAVLMALTSTLAQADTSPALVEETGTIARGADGAWIGTTQPAETTFSFGRFRLAGEARVPFTLAATVQRLDADALSVEAHVLGGAVLLRDGEVALWVDDATFARDGWRPLPGFRGQRAHRVEVIQTAAVIAVRVDGAEVARWPVRAAAASGPVALALKGSPRRRARLRITALALR